MSELVNERFESEVEYWVLTMKAFGDRCGGDMLSILETYGPGLTSWLHVCRLGDLRPVTPFPELN